MSQTLSELKRVPLFRSDLQKYDLSRFSFSGRYGLAGQALRLGIPGTEELHVAVLAGVYHRDVAVEADLRIIDVGKGETGWGGYLIRGYTVHTLGGYLIYLRANGMVELLTLDQKRYDLGQVIDFRPDEWTHLGIEADETQLRISVRQRSNLVQVDFPSAFWIGAGHVALGVHDATVEFRDITVDGEPTAVEAAARQ